MNQRKSEVIFVPENTL